MADDTSLPEAAKNGAPETPRKRMTFYRMADAKALGHDEMPFVGIDEGVMKGFARMAEAKAGETGARTLTLFKEPGDQGMSLVYAWFKGGFVLPRHSHDADCLYYVIGGSLQMGSVKLGPGDGVFIPADDAYTYEVGPAGVEVLEFRNATRFHLKFKNNDDAHWGRQVAARNENMDRWATQTRSPTGLQEA